MLQFHGNSNLFSHLFSTISLWKKNRGYHNWSDPDIVMNLRYRSRLKKESEDGVFKMLRNDNTRFLTTILTGTTYCTIGRCLLFLMNLFSYWKHLCRVVNIGATALVTEAATAIFGEAGVITATGVLTVCLDQI